MKQIILFISVLMTTSALTQLTPAYQDIWIPMSDGDSLLADVYIPAGVDSAEVVFVQTPYNKDLFYSGLPLGIGLGLNSQAYIWIIMDWRGFYGSSGADLSSVDRGQDAYDACDWIVAQSWHKDRIGTWGPSALGNIQYQLIAKNHPNHTCAVPLVAHAHQSYDAYFYGGVLEEARLNQLDALGYGLSPTIYANPYYSALWTFTENSTWFADDIQIPTLQIGGWYDHNIDKMMTFYTACRNSASPSVQDEQWLLVGPWVHGGTGTAYVGSVNQGQLSYPNAELVNNDMAWDFFNYYLLDSANNWQSTPKITYFDMGGTDDWLTSNADDIASPGSDVLYLTNGNLLISGSGTGSSGFISDPNDPSPTIGGATLHTSLLQGPYDQTILDSRSDVISFSTGDLPQDVSITGRITLNLYVSATVPDCDIAIRLVDRYPSGINMLITDGVRRMRFRNGFAQSDEVFMNPGTVYEIEIELPFLQYTWKAGHEIKIYISGNHASRFHVNLQDGGPMYAAGTGTSGSVTIHHDASYPSRINLPGNNPFLSATNAEMTPVVLFPNPVESKIFINSEQIFDSYQILDFSGRVVQDGIYSPEIDSDGLEKGSYIILLLEADQIVSQQKFIKI